MIARIVGRRAERLLGAALPGATGDERRVARARVADAVTDMPDLMRAALSLALPMVGLLRRIGMDEVDRLGRGLALAAVFERRAGEEGAGR